jgi:nucleoporin NUP82
MLAVYETIDLGLVSTLTQISAGPNEPPLLHLLQGNHPVFHTDPIHDDTVYAYHAFGVHALDIGPVLQSLATALRAEDDTSLDARVQKSVGTSVHPILTTFSVERRYFQTVWSGDMYDTVALTDVPIQLWQSRFPTTSIFLIAFSSSLRPCGLHLSP